MLKKKCAYEKKLINNLIVMKNSILIIGFGNMGMSHFTSFKNKRYKIYIVEKKNNINITKIKKNILINKKFFVLKKIPKNKDYFLTIVSCKSKERFSLVKNFFNNYNSCKFLLLEKFCFFKLEEFYKFKKKFSFKTKPFLNSWSHILANKIKFKNNTKNFNITCHIEEGFLLTNISHILHFFCFLNNNYSIKKIFPKKHKLIKSVRYKSYNELLGTLNFNSSEGNKLLIKTKKKIVFTNNFLYQKKTKHSY